MNEGRLSVLTIGHSTHSLEAFVNLLNAHSVGAVADVRSTPYSGYSPHFNRESLRSALRQHQIQYVFLGRELGARSDDPACYENGRVQYKRLARTELFQRGIERVESGSNAYRVALMCAEKDPLDCHRSILVAQALYRNGTPVQHILPDGRLEDHESSITRLLDALGFRTDNSFPQMQADLVEQALAKQERKIAFVAKRDHDPEGTRS